MGQPEDPVGAGSSSTDDGATSTREVDRIVDCLPYFASQDQLLYIQRGWDASRADLTLEQWRAYQARDPDLESDEVFDQLNINSGFPEVWRERGRSRWARLPERERIHFSPASVLYLFARSYRSGSVRDRRDRIVRELGLSPTLREWQAYVAEYAELEVPDPADLESPWPAHACAVWHDSRKGRDHVFRWFPPSVWLHRTSGVVGSVDAAGSPEAWRMEKANAIAAALDARVHDGVTCFLPLYRKG